MFMCPFNAFQLYSTIYCFCHHSIKIKFCLEYLKNTSSYDKNIRQTIKRFIRPNNIHTGISTLKDTAQVYESNLEKANSLKHFFQGQTQLSDCKKQLPDALLKAHSPHLSNINISPSELTETRKATGPDVNSTVLREDISAPFAIFFNMGRQNTISVETSQCLSSAQEKRSSRYEQLQTYLPPQ